MWRSWGETIQRVSCKKKVLIAGFGSRLRGDDAFGVELLSLVEKEIKSFFENVELLEASSNGLLLIQELFGGYEVLIVLDSVKMGGEPGKVYVLKVDDIDTGLEEHIAPGVAELHELNPQRAFIIARALGVLPKNIYIIGCEPESYDYIALELSPPVKKALPRAREALLNLLNNICS